VNIVRTKEKHPGHSPTARKTIMILVGIYVFFVFCCHRKPQLVNPSICVINLYFNLRSTICRKENWYPMVWCRTNVLITTPWKNNHSHQNIHIPRQSDTTKTRLVRRRCKGTTILFRQLIVPITCGILVLSCLVLSWIRSIRESPVADLFHNKNGKRWSVCIRYPPRKVKTPLTVTVTVNSGLDQWSPM